MGVTRPADVFTAGTIFQSQCSLSNHLTGIRTNDVDSQNSIGLGVTQELDHTVGLLIALGTGVGTEGEIADFVLDALLLELGLILAHPGDFWMCVHDRGNGSIIDVSVTLGDVLDTRYGFFFGFVSEHRAECAVADDADVREFSPVLLVNYESSLVVCLKSNILQTESSCVWAAADGDQNDVSVELSVGVSE